MRSKIDWVSYLYWEGNLPFLLCFTLYSRENSKYKPGGLIFGGHLTEDSLGDDFGGLIFGGAYGMFSTCIILQSVSNSLQSAVCKRHTPSHDRVLGYCYE